MEAVTLRSGDGVEVRLEAGKLAAVSRTLATVLEDVPGTRELPLPHVDGETLRTFAEFCRSRSANLALAVAWDANFAQSDNARLCAVMEAASMLDAPALVALCAKAIADSLRGKTSVEMRAVLGIRNDLAPEREAAILRDNQWALDA